MKKISIYAVMVGGLLAVSSLTASAESQSNVNATVANYKGNVEYAAPGSNDFKPVSQETPIPLGSKIRTGGTGQVTVVPFPGAAMTLSPNSEVDMSTMNISTESNHIAKKTALMDLKRGMATVAIDHNAAQQIPVDFKVKTPTSVASAVGTQYVTAVVDGVTYVKVIDGTVKFGKFGGPSTPVTPTSGVAVFNADGTVSFPPTLPPGVQTALDNAPVTETDGIAKIGVTPGGHVVGIPNYKSYRPSVPNTQQFPEPPQPQVSNDGGPGPV